MRAPSLPSMWPRFKSQRQHHMRVEFVVNSLLMLWQVFLWVLWFLWTLLKNRPTFPNSNSNRNQVDEEPLSGCATSKLLFIYLFIIYMTWNEWVQRCQWLSTTVTSLCPAYPIKEIGTLQLVQCKVFTKMYIILQFHNVYNILIFLLPIITDLPPVCLLHWQPPWCSLNWREKNEGN